MFTFTETIFNILIYGTYTGPIVNKFMELGYCHYYDN